MNSMFFYPAIEEIRNFYNLPLKNSMVSLPGGGGEGTDVKCNSPICSVNLATLCNGSSYPKFKFNR